MLELLPGGPDHLVLRAHLASWHGLIHIVERARRILGVGSWTAHYIALRLGERDAFPEDDLGLRHAAARLSSLPLAPRVIAMS